jgi:zinc transporter ZupT
MGIAFGLVVLAGLCAPLGACVVVFMRKSHTGLLAASIALAAGVMVFISLTEVRAPASSTAVRKLTLELQAQALCCFQQLLQL